MTIMSDLQPDQQPHLWDDHVSLYLEVFEPFTQGLALRAIESLAMQPGSSVIDSGAGTGGATLELARRGCRVTAIDAANAMVARVKERAKAEGLALDAFVMDGQQLGLPPLKEMDPKVRRNGIEPATINDTGARADGRLLVAIEHAPDPLHFARQVAVMCSRGGADPDERA